MQTKTPDLAGLSAQGSLLHKTCTAQRADHISGTASINLCIVSFLSPLNSKTTSCVDGLASDDDGCVPVVGEAEAALLIVRWGGQDAKQIDIVW